MRQGLFLQDLRMHPFHKWVLCGVNGSCTELNPLVFIQGGVVGKASLLESQDIFSTGGRSLFPGDLMELQLPMLILL